MKIQHEKLRAAAEIDYSGLMLLVGVGLPILLLKTALDASSSGILVLELLGGAGLALQFIIHLTKFSKRPQEIYLVVFLVVTPAVLLATA
jgi:hypothetical protein